MSKTEYWSVCGAASSLVLVCADDGVCLAESPCSAAAAAATDRQARPTHAIVGARKRRADVLGNAMSSWPVEARREATVVAYVCHPAQIEPIRICGLSRFRAGRACRFSRGGRRQPPTVR